MWFIAEKYKLYDRLRAHISGKTKSDPSETSSSPRPAKRRKTALSEDINPNPSSSTQLPRSKLEPQSKPQGPPSHPAALNPYDSPRAVRACLTPTAFRTSIAPTPQRDGKVLGLFDLLSPESATKVAASQRKPLLNPSATPTKPRDVCATPPKRALEALDEEISRRHSRTPQSSSKRNYLNTFLTPSSRRTIELKTPTSKTVVKKLQFDDTPEFLKRDSQCIRFPRPAKKKQAEGAENQTGEEEQSWSPVAVRMPRKPAGRTLSQLMKDLRDIQEESIEDELDILRGLENEGNGGGRVTATMPKIQPSSFLVKDSQIEMPLGPDAGSEGWSDDDDLEVEGKGRGGRPLKIYKKKGQKRSTRKVNIKPTAGKWKPEPEWKGGEEEGDGDEAEAVAETQTSAKIPEADGEDQEDDPDADAKYLEIGEQALRARLVKQRELVAEADAGTSMISATDGKPKKVTKINALAHTNFRALKIKNKNSKAKGKGGRFARRR